MGCTLGRGCSSLEGVGEGGEALREVGCEAPQGECWLVVWKERDDIITYSDKLSVMHYIRYMH